MLRIGLFLLTNIAVILVASVTLSILGVDSYLEQSGGGLNLQSLLIFSAVFGFSGAFISLLMSKWMAKRTMGVHVIINPQNDREKWLLETVERQSKIVGVKTPEVGIFNSPVLNAFATGASKNKSLVAVSSGLLDKMTQKEAEAVVGHEMSHIANGDMVTLTLIQGVVNTFVIFFARVIGHIIDRVVLKNERGHGIGFFISTFVAEIILGILASTIVMWFSRKREFIADTGGADLAGNNNMIAALKRLKIETSKQEEQDVALPDEMAAFGISGSVVSQGIKKLFMTHPPLDARIEALRKRG